MRYPSPGQFAHHPLDPDAGVTSSTTEVELTPFVERAGAIQSHPIQSLEDPFAQQDVFRQVLDLAKLS
jgi:hypothetical protein